MKSLMISSLKLATNQSRAEQSAYAEGDSRDKALEHARPGIPMGLSRITVHPEQNVNQGRS